MTRLTKEHRALIVREMMRKTNFKERFAAELKRLGVALREEYVRWLEEQHGRELMEYIGRMKPAYRRKLCREVDGAWDAYYGRDLVAVAKHLGEMTGRAGDEGYQDATFFTSFAGGKSMLVKFQRPAWRPGACGDFRDFHFAKLKNARDLLAPLDALAAEFMTTARSLEAFLYSVTTLARLEALMPEAAALVPETAHPIAVIPNPGNALAALTRAGFFERAAEGAA